MVANDATTLIDGRARARARALGSRVAFDVERLAGLGARCGLATVLVGSDDAAGACVRRLRRAAGTDRETFYRSATICVVGRSNNVGKPSSPSPPSGVRLQNTVLAAEAAAKRR